MFRGLLLMLCALALTASAAAAAEDEVFVDPGSPSGKEYALPIESARKQAAGDVRNRSSDSQATPLFGEGVDRDAGSAGGSGSGHSDVDGGSRRGGASGDGGGETSSPQRADPDGGTPVTARAQAASPDGGSGTIAIIGAGAGVLLLGGAIGLVLRRRAARTT